MSRQQETNLVAHGTESLCYIRGEQMIFRHNVYLDYELPGNWCAEEDGDNLFLYNPDGNGAITISFINVLSSVKSLEEQMSTLAKGFVAQNNISIHGQFICLCKEHKKILCGTGTSSDGWFIKLWIVAKFPKIVFATYHSEQKNWEVETCDSIIDSFNFTF